MIACTAALVLLLDASGSVKPPEWQAQLLGTAEALTSPRVLRLVETSGPIAITAIAFADDAAPLLPWVVLRQAGDAMRAAQALAAQPRTMFGGTRLGPALTAAVQAFEDAPCVPERAVIDISTDGEADPAAAEAARDAGITINGIGVGGAPGASPAEWLRNHVITPGGFAVTAAGWGDFAQAMQRKLALEIAAR